MFPTLMRFGSFRLATYGVLVAAGYLTGILWLNSNRERMGFDEKRFWGLIYSMFFGAVMGGKVLYWLVEWRAVLSGELHPLRDFRYGFVFMGGFMGSALAAWLYRRRHHFGYLKVGDYFGVSMPMGHTIGRLACMAAGCCMGRPTSMPWGVRFTHPESLVAEGLLGVPLHPTPVYESAANALMTAATYCVLRKVRRGKLPEGTSLLGYVGLYGLTRFFIEFFRGDERGGFLLSLSPSQWLSMIWVLVSIAGLWAVFKSWRRKAA